MYRINENYLSFFEIMNLLKQKSSVTLLKKNQCNNSMSKKNKFISSSPYLLLTTLSLFTMVDRSYAFLSLTEQSIDHNNQKLNKMPRDLVNNKNSKFQKQNQFHNGQQIHSFLHESIDSNIPEGVVDTESNDDCTEHILVEEEEEDQSSLLAAALSKSYHQSSINNNQYRPNSILFGIGEEGGTAKEPWYMEESELPFECTGCGKCCRTKGDVYMDPEETLAASKLLNLSVREFTDQYAKMEDVESGWTLLRSKSEEGSCIFLNEENNQCQIYEARPLQCSTYPFWPRIMSNKNSWNEEVRIFDTDDETTTTGKKWTLEEGGCEGMQPIRASPADEKSTMDSGVSSNIAAQRLAMYARYQKRLPNDFKDVVHTEEGWSLKF